MNFIEIILPNKKYKDYMDFVLGLILISIVAMPITKFINSPLSFSFQDTTKNTHEYSYNSDIDYAKILYENQLTTQFSSYLSNFDIIFSNAFVTTNNDYIITDVSFDIKSNLTVESLEIKNIKNDISNEYNIDTNNIHINITN